VNEKPFATIVGQSAAKRTLEHLIECYNYSHFLPSLLNVSPKGNGKTTLAIETARNLHQFNGVGKFALNPANGKPLIKPLVKINCATINNLKAFIGIVVSYIQDKDCTVLFDEASELPHDVSMAMLDIFNTTGADTNYKTQLIKDDFTCDFDFKRQSFIFCTSEPHKVFHALADRLKRITLDEYKINELAEIMSRNLPGIHIEPELLTEISTVLRGNARAAKNTAIDIFNYLKGSKEFNQRDWTAFKRIYNILPLGLSPLELQLLRTLGGHPNGMSLTCLSAKTGMSRESLMRDVEIYLQKSGLMTVETSGRHISSDGMKYLKDMGLRQNFLKI
jgi:Holliday junction resolvasome RuvABC ATP-dependent DNA helicase subunit